MSKPPPDQDPIRAQMRAARRSAGLSLADVEFKHGLNAVRVGSWERGDRNPGSIAHLRHWVEALGRQLVVLEPDQYVVSTKDADEAGRTLQWVVSYGPDHDGLINCASEEEARTIAARMPFARVGRRVVSRSPVEYEDGAV